MAAGPGRGGGALLFFENGAGAMKYFLCVIGMVMIVEGLPYFAFPERMRTWIARVAASPARTLRTVGALLMALGLWMVYLGSPG
jgi:hypothetical protein